MLFYVVSHIQDVWAIVLDPIADDGDFPQLVRLDKTRQIIEITMVIINVSCNGNIQTHASEEYLLVPDQ